MPAALASSAPVVHSHEVAPDVVLQVVIQAEFQLRTTEHDLHPVQGQHFRYQKHTEDGGR